MDRIIGDFLEINADIVKQEVDSNLPKFLSKMKAKLFRKRLLKSLYKLKSSNYILNSRNLSELFTYTFNNFPPMGEYNSIKHSKIIEDTGYSIRSEAVIEFDNIKCIIYLDSREKYFEINVSQTLENNNKMGFNLSLTELSSEKDQYKDIVSNINDKLVDELVSYIESIIKNYI